MPEALILEFTGVDLSAYAAVNAELGIDMTTGAGEWPPGLISHAAGMGDDGSLLVTEVWASRADQQAFMESRLGQALAAGGVTAMPSIRWVPLVAYHTPAS